MIQIEAWPIPLWLLIFSPFPSSTSTHAVMHLFSFPSAKLVWISVALLIHCIEVQIFLLLTWLVSWHFSKGYQNRCNNFTKEIRFFHLHRTYYLLAGLGCWNLYYALTSQFFQNAVVKVNFFHCSMNVIWLEVQYVIPLLFIRIYTFFHSSCTY